jgi:hypothetical protein
MEAYGARYIGDLRAFSKAYLLAIIAILPLVALNVGAFGIFVYVYLLLFGAVILLAVSVLTAVFENYGYKLLIYLLAVAVSAYRLWDVQSLQGASPNFNAIVFCQIVFLLGLLYLVLERARIGAWIMRHVRAES